jgi:hypothetical protein
MPAPLSSGLSFRQLAPKSSPIFGSLSLKNCPCLPGPAGPPTASRSASEPRERRHRSGQKQRLAPGGAQDRPTVGAPWFSGPAGAVALVGRDRGRSQSLAAARLTVSAPSGSESAPRAMRNNCSFGSFGIRQLALQSRPMFGSLFLKNWVCLPGPAGPPIASRSASEPRHRSLQKQRLAPGGAQDRPTVGAPWFSGPAGAVALVGRDRGRSQSLAAARLTLSAPSGSESAPRAMRNIGSFGSFGSFGLRAADFSARTTEWNS